MSRKEIKNINIQEKNLILSSLIEQVNQSN
jgi:hypothetical protein